MDHRIAPGISSTKIIHSAKNEIYSLQKGIVFVYSIIELNTPERFKIN